MPPVGELLAGMCVRRDSTPTYHTVHSLFLAINRQCAPPVGRDVPHRRGKLQPGTSLSKGQNFPAPVRNKEKRVEPGGIFPDMILPCLTPSCGCGTSHGFLGGSTCSEGRTKFKSIHSVQCCWSSKLGLWSAGSR